ncbi:MAG: DoxX family protein [Planctomycetes bacterium]|nr:DoxX family protein [Planctomycetota bacterium]
MPSGLTESGSPATRLTRPWQGLGLLMVLLVLLRLSIGWHFLFEGLQKVYSLFTPKPFSAAVYFRESAGPLSSSLKPLLPDPEKELAAKLSPDGIQARWRDISASYIEGLSGEARAKAESARDASQAEAIKWLAGGNAISRKTYQKALTRWESSGNSADLEAANKARKECVDLATAYRKKQEALATELGALAGMKPADVLKLPKVAPETGTDALPLFLTDSSTVGSIRSTALDSVRTHLTSQSGEATAKEGAWSRMDKAVKLADDWADKSQAWLGFGERSVETPSPDGKETGALKQVLTTPERIARHKKLTEALDEQVRSRRSWDFLKDVDKAALASAKAAQSKSRTELSEDIDKMESDLVKKLQAMGATAQAVPPRMKLLDIMDLVTIAAITAIGAGLFTGTLTRFAALGGAAFLLMTYLAVPPFPWLPNPPLNEGNYVFINKNFVEMMALLVIAATPSGRWFGLDAVFMPILFGYEESEKERVD